MSDIERLLASYMAGTLSRRAFARRLLTLGASLGFVETLLGPSIADACAQRKSRL